MIVCNATGTQKKHKEVNQSKKKLEKNQSTGTSVTLHQG